MADSQPVTDWPEVSAGLAVLREALVAGLFVVAWPAVAARWAALLVYAAWLARRTVLQLAAQKVIGQVVQVIHPAVHFAA